MLFVAVVAGVVFITLGPAAHSHAKRQARPRPPRLRRHAAVPAAAGQSGRRDADHLRQQLADVPAAAFSASWPNRLLRSDSLWPATWSTTSFHRGTSFIYNVLYVALIYFFCYFWTAITFNPKDMADNLKNFGTFIPGYRPGKRTADYLEKVMVRITYVGAGFLAVVAIMPTIISGVARRADQVIASFYGGTGLLIAVSVAFDLVQKIDSHLVMRNYTGCWRNRSVGESAVARCRGCRAIRRLVDSSGTDLDLAPFVLPCGSSSSDRPAPAKGRRPSGSSDYLGIAAPLDRRHAARGRRRRSTELGRQAASYMQAGKLVPDDIIVGIVGRAARRSRLRRAATCSTAFRAPSPQAEALDEMLAERGTPLDLVLELRGRAGGARPAAGRPRPRRRPAGDRSASGFGEYDRQTAAAARTTTAGRASCDRSTATARPTKSSSGSSA